MCENPMDVYQDMIMYIRLGWALKFSNAYIIFT